MVWGIAGGGQRHLFLVDAHEQAAAPALVELPIDPGLILTRSASGSSGQLFALSHGIGPAGTWTEVSGFDPVAPGGASGPAWTHSMGAGGSAPELACDDGGYLVVAAQYLPASAAVAVDVLVGATGAVYASAALPAAGLDGLVVSADGRRIAVAAGLDHYVLDRDCQTLLHLVRPVTTKAIALSPQGEHLAVGAFGQLEVYAEGAVGWSLETLHPAHPDPAEAGGWVPTQVALGLDGEALAVAWWKSASGLEAAFEIWSGPVRERRLALPEGAGSLQNLPVGAAITRSGSRAAFGVWGNGVDPELWLLDRDDPQKDQAWDLPGSVRSVALDGTGTRVLVGHGDAHANTFTSTGAVRLYDTGERDIQQLGGAVLGGVLPLAAKNDQASLVLFLVGALAPPAVVPGVPGSLLLDRASLTVVPVGADATGRADAAVAIPGGSAWLGASFAVQAAYRTQGGTVLGSGVARAFVLE